MTPNHTAPDLDITPFQTRRQKLIERMHAAGGGIAVLPTAPEVSRNRDTHYPYRYDSYFHYLSGFAEPESVIVVIAGDNPRSILFCREKNEEREIWDGFRYGPDAAREAFGFDEAWTIGDLDRRLPDLLAEQPVLWSGFGYDRSWDDRLTRALNTVRANARAGSVPPHSLRDLRAELDEMRLIKDSSEIAIMREAARISALAHRQAMIHTRPGCFEYEVEAELLYVFRKHGAESPAYPSIVASGPNACVLHYVSNNRQMQANELLLIDAGCELKGYAADITRSFPVSGRYTGAQRALYELVLAAHTAACQEVRPGAHWNQPHEAAVKVIAQGLLDLGLLRGTLDGVLESGDYRRYFMHRTGHWLGRDVHDAGEYKKNGEWRLFEPGMMLTIEPGCYVRPDKHAPEAFWNIGIRIEDDALVTPTGHELITGDVPRSIDDIETLMREGKHVCS